MSEIRKLKEKDKVYSLRLPQELYDKLMLWAEQEFRSVNSLMVSVLNQAATKKERESDTEGNQIAERVGLAA